MKTPQKIIVSRTDSIGDVVLTLPLCGLLKKNYPDAKIIFLGNTYTQPVISCSNNIDELLNWDEIRRLPAKQKVEKVKSVHADWLIHVFPKREIALLAKSAKIPNRLGTRNRWYHWLYCNRLVPLSRRKSALHEAQLNIRLASSLLNNSNLSCEELIPYYGLNKINPLSTGFLSLLDKNKFNLIIHPASKGSAREWSLEHYAGLISALPKDKIRIFISGTKADGEKLSGWLQALPKEVVNITGKLSLPEFISFIHAADGIIAASTGPLHIAAALGKFALGIYPPIKPMHPERWAPIGKNASFACVNKACDACRNAPAACSCINEISVSEVRGRVMKWLPK